MALIQVPFIEITAFTAGHKVLEKSNDLNFLPKFLTLDEFFLTVKEADSINVTIYNQRTMVKAIVGKKAG